MNLKIDNILLSRVVALDNEKKLECIVKAKNFSQVKKFLKQKNIEVLSEYLFINSFFVNVKKSELLNLSKSVSVEKIYSVSTASMMMNVSKKILGCDKTELTGKGVCVGVIDTGIAPHFDFYLSQKRVAGFIDFVGGAKYPYDDNGHGTFVSGVLAGGGNSSVGKYSGIAPQSKIYSLKALDKNGEAYSNKILDAMEWIFDNHKKKNIRVVCMSFGSEPLGYNDPIMVGAESLWKDGVVVVSAAGNSGPEYQTIKSPGVSTKIITVGGFDDNRFSEEDYDKSLFEIAEFSSRGPAFNRYKPDVVAPAVDITSCDRRGGYTKLSGTSVATPMIAGLSCLIIEKYPSINPDQVKRLLITNAESVTYNRNLEGFGVPKIF